MESITSSSKRMTVSVLPVFGRQRSILSFKNASSIRLNRFPMPKTEFIIKSSAIDEITGIIIKAAYTNEVGDGMIFASSSKNVTLEKEGCHRVKWRQNE